MDFEDEFDNRIFSKNLYFLDDEDARKISELIRKSRSPPTKEKARRLLAWADSLSYRGLLSKLGKVCDFLLCQWDTCRGWI